MRQATTGRRSRTVSIIDKAEFPRGKLCSGWITLGVLDDLNLDIDDYRRGRVFQPMSGFSIGTVGGLRVRVDYGKTVSYGILRRQFDDYLLRRCGASLVLGEAVKSIELRGRRVDRQRAAPRGDARGGRRPLLSRREALGHSRPTRSRHCGTGNGDRAHTGTRGCMSRCAGVARTLLLRGPAGLWLVLSQGQPFNVGLGRVVPQQLPQQVRDFYQWMKRQGRLPDGLPADFPGHAYLTYEQAARRLVGEGVVWIGDAAGLSHNESGEGIRPAIQSGLLAAETILAARGDYRVETLDAYRRRMECNSARGGPVCRRPRDIRLPPPSRPLAARAAVVCEAHCIGSGGSCTDDRVY